MDRVVHMEGQQSRAEVSEAELRRLDEALRVKLAQKPQPWETRQEATVRYVEDELRRKLDAAIPGLVRWLGSCAGGAVAQGSRLPPWCMSHPERQKVWQPLVAALRSEDDDRIGQLAQAAHVALNAGLRQRLAVRDEEGKLWGGTALSAGEQVTFRVLCELGATPDPGIAVCTDCHLAFPPSRKSRAKKCDRCHVWARPFVPASPIGAPSRREVQQAEAAGGEQLAAMRRRQEEVAAIARAGGWEPWRATVARRTFDERGEPVGWKSHTVACCEGCGERMEGCRRHARTCSSKCRERVRQGVLVRPG